MTIEQTTIQDLVIINPTVFNDERGYFFEAYNKAKFNENGIMYDFIQDNQSFSKRGVIRGLHLQINPFAQAKLVRVLQGEILDVPVDLRKHSCTYGFDDPTLNIDWQLNPEEVIVSEKDLVLPRFDRIDWEF